MTLPLLLLVQGLLQHLVPLLLLLSIPLTSLQYTNCLERQYLSSDTAMIFLLLLLLLLM